MQWGLARIIIKCTECGNTFKKDSVAKDEVVTCPICEAQYKAVATTDNRLRFEDFVLDESDSDDELES
jgi:DNA-directed RNA polymerase subunit RPC12/RpoP